LTTLELRPCVTTQAGWLWVLAFQLYMKSGCVNVAGGIFDSRAMMAHVTGESRYQATLFPEVLDEVLGANDSGAG